MMATAVMVDIQSALVSAWVRNLSVDFVTVVAVVVVSFHPCNQSVEETGMKRDGTIDPRVSE